MTAITDRTKTILEKYHPGTLPLVPEVLVSAGHFPGVSSARKWIYEHGVTFINEGENSTRVTFDNEGENSHGVISLKGSTMLIPRGVIFKKDGRGGRASKALTWRESDEQALADLNEIYPGETIKMESVQAAPEAVLDAGKIPAAEPVNHAAEVEATMPITPASKALAEAPEKQPVVDPEIVADPMPSGGLGVAPKGMYGQGLASEKRPLTVEERLALPATPEQLELAEKACAGSWRDAPGLIRQIKIQPGTVYCPECSTKGCPVQFRLCGQCKHHGSCNMYLLASTLQP